VVATAALVLIDSVPLPAPVEQHRPAAARYLALYVAPLLLALPIWARHRISALGQAPVQTYAINLAVTVAAFGRFVFGTFLPFSGHILFLSYTALTTRGARLYRARCGAAD